MSAAVQAVAKDGVTAKDHAAVIAEHFRVYNEEFGRITRRAALNFLAEDWHQAQLDAVARIELYEERVARCVALIACQLEAKRTEAALWVEIKRAYEMIVARRPDSDFYRTFFNSVTRDLFGTVGVNPEVEFCATSVGRASGAVPIRVYRIGGSLPTAVREVLTDLPFGAALGDIDAAVHRISAEIGRFFQTGRLSGQPESIELIEPLFYRGMNAFVVGRLIGDSSITPLLISFSNSPKGVGVDAVMLSRAEVGSLFGYSRSYFHVDLPVVSAAITLLRSFMPRKSIDELYTVLGRAKQGKTERYFSLQRHLDKSIDSFVHAPGERGLVMIVFTLPSHDLVFKVIRDRFGAPKTSTREDVIERYQFVFRHDRAGRLVDAQEFKRLRLPRARFMPALADELLGEAAETCRIEGDDLIIEHCYIERRLRPLNLFLREADPAAAETAIIDYGGALRDLAASNVFPGDLLLKNFGVTSHGRVIFYDYDEIGLVTDCVFRDLPQPTSLEEEMSAEPWFHCGPRDVFPEQWLPFLSIPPALEGTFKQHHAELLTAAWWRDLSRALSVGPPSGAAAIPGVTPLRAVAAPIGTCAS
ncbi:MAG TPA: bifunctional isocitrate dehydrogenase kinase/phosphatase [Steroidobacteraceae bacterium]|jgi:isocitrate dehydrogenase kinase/phosphatase|nr:bifunctional isocitrate dehydrogenase kinase/phosphatase [Steroidobacteraceae bacterium]